ncbi:MAG: signal peptidase I [Acidobacteriota bacterium]
MDQNDTAGGEPDPVRSHRRPRRFLFEYAQAAAIALIFALFARTFLVQAFRIPSQSMEDSLLVGDHILVNKFTLAPLASPLERAVLPLAPIRRGDVVVFRPPHDPEQDYIKRVIGLPGETIEIINDVVYVREPGRAGYTALLEPYVVHKEPGAVPAELRDFGTVEIPEGEYFVMGDNRDNSLDSRDWGTVPRRTIIGRALLVYWSFDGSAAAGARAAPRDERSAVGRLLYGATAVFRGTRWNRSGMPIR